MSPYTAFWVGTASTSSVSLPITGALRLSTHLRAISRLMELDIVTQQAPGHHGPLTRGAGFPSLIPAKRVEAVSTSS